MLCHIYYFIFSSFVLCSEESKRKFLCYSTEIVYILSCGEPQIFNEFPFTRKEISLQHTEGHSMVKKFFEVIILQGKLCFVYLISEKRRLRELAESSFVQVIHFRLGMVLWFVIIQAKPYYIWNSFPKLRASVFNPLWQCFKKLEE